jgi:hypothetical protein
MAYEKPKPKHDWRSFLTAEEAKTIAAFERKRDRARRAMSEASSVISPIQNRAINRAKYANRQADGD